MKEGCLFCAILCIVSYTGWAARVGVSLDRKDSGFFLKSLYSEAADENGWEKQQFVVTRPQGSVSVKAQYGPYTTEQHLPLSLLQEAAANHSGDGIGGLPLSNVVVDDLDISAHLVSRTITQERPLLQVLFHASQVSADPANKVRASTQSPAVASRWCLQMHVEKGEQEITSVCVLSAQDNVCISELTLPTSWWSQQTEAMQSVDVYYSVYGIDQNLECSSASNSIVPGKSDVHERFKSFISSVTLSHGQVTYQELKEDQHILIYIPQKSFYPGSKFRVPVKLQAESDLQIFVIKMKARRGLRVVGAQPSDPEHWRITMDLNHKKHGAMVTAFVKDRDTYSKMDRVQDIFEWIVEVEDGATGDDRGRLTLTLEYEMNTQQKERYGSVENRVVARVEIQQDDTYAIVPVIKTAELQNVAVLTGSTQSLSMHIYSVSQAGKVAEITSQTTCHSGDDEVLKVAQSCNLVYLDGSETKGSSSVSVIAKYGRHTRFLFFKVWVPELPLDLTLSDDKLSQIKGWKGPLQPVRRKARGVDFGLLTHPDLLFQEEGMRSEDLASTCRLRYQQAVVDVYAHFHIPEGDSKDQHLVHRKAMFRVTEALAERLRIADLSIARLDSNVVEGLKPGRTEVQVVTRFGSVIGAHEVRVVQNKVNIERLEVNVVTGVSVALSNDSELPGTLTAILSTQSQLRRKYQEGILDVAIRFDDETLMPLRYIPATDYFLDMDTLNNHVVAFGPMVSPDTPRVIALGQGKGELLKVSLELGDSCQRKKSRPLAVSYVYIDIDFSKDSASEAEKLQNDAGHFPGNDKDKYVSHDKGPDGGVFHVSLEDKKGGKDTGDKSAGGQAKKGVDNIPLDELDLVDLTGVKTGDGVGDYPSHEAQQQLIEMHGMTPLEIGMYVLLGVFCLAIIVFMINCMVFVVRYRRKQKPHERKDPVAHANDWVWIGRATLERNAINTTCSQALMPDADFNGNQTAAMQLLQPSLGTLSNRNSATTTTVNPPSNRNSVISTYKGSECSIRITANPLLDQQNEATDEDVLEEDSSPTDSASSTSGASQQGEGQEEEDDPCEGQSHCQNQLLRGEPANQDEESEDAASQHAGGPSCCSDMSESSAPSSLDRSEMAARREAMHNALLESLRAQQDSANGNVSEADWDYEAMGMTYEELMEYFDNLKESVA